MNSFARFQRSNRLARGLFNSSTPSNARAVAGAALVLCTANASAALQGRNLDSNPATFEAYSDTALNITWLTDADIAMTRGEAKDGRKNWGDATAYVAALDVFGVSGWRLPKVLPRDGSSVYNDAFTNDGSSDRGYAAKGIGWGTTSELGHMFYVTLANSAFNLTQSAPFSHLSANDYWTGQLRGQIATRAFFLNTGIGLQDSASLASTYKLWAVRDGDIGTPVPEPQTFVLMLAGLAAIVLTKRRSRRPVPGRFG